MHVCILSRYKVPTILCTQFAGSKGWVSSMKTLTWLWETPIGLVVCDGDGTVFYILHTKIVHIIICSFYPRSIHCHLAHLRVCVCLKYDLFDAGCWDQEFICCWRCKKSQHWLQSSVFYLMYYIHWRFVFVRVLGRLVEWWFLWLDRLPVIFAFPVSPMSQPFIFRENQPSQYFSCSYDTLLFSVVPLKHVRRCALWNFLFWTCAIVWWHHVFVLAGFMKF